MPAIGQPGAAALDDDVPVVQHRPAEFGHVLDPLHGAGEVLVVAGDVDPGQPSLRRRQRRDLRASLLDRSVGEVTGVHDHVRDRARFTAATILADQRPG